MTASFYKTVYQRKFEELPRWKKLVNEIIGVGYLQNLLKL
jgi:hypothetical protein